MEPSPHAVGLPLGASDGNVRFNRAVSGGEAVTTLQNASDESTDWAVDQHSRAAMTTEVGPTAWVMLSG